MRVRYRARRDALVEALAEALPEATVRGIAAGLHATVELPDGDDEQAILDEAGRRRIAFATMSEYRVDADRPADAPARLRAGPRGGDPRRRARARGRGAEQPEVQYARPRAIYAERIAVVSATLRRAVGLGLAVVAVAAVPAAAGASTISGKVAGAKLPKGKKGQTRCAPCAPRTW